MIITTTTASFGTVGTIVKEGSPLFSLSIYAPLGDSHSPTQAATRQLYADLLVSGAGKYTREQFHDAVSELGAEFSVTAVKGAVLMQLSSDATKAPALLKLLKLVVEEPHFTSTERRRARTTLTNKYELYKDNARALARAALTQHIFPETDHRHSFSPNALIKGLAKVTPSAIPALHKRLRTVPWIVTIAGGADIVATTKTTIAKLHTPTQSLDPTTKATTTPPKRRTVALTSVPSKQNIELSIGHALPLTFTSPDYPALAFGLAVLGKWGGFAGRLMSSVREKEGLTYGIYAGPEDTSHDTSGLWRIMTFFAPKDVEQGITSTLREVTTIAKQGITDNEWQRFRDILTTQETLVFDSLGGTATLVRDALSNGLSWDEYRSYRTALLNVTKDQINKALKTYIVPEQLIISAAGPVKDVEKTLLAFTS